jgi:hypothetical protein
VPRHHDHNLRTEHRRLLEIVITVGKEKDINQNREFRLLSDMGGAAISAVRCVARPGFHL